ncbi:uncharacterized protein LOC135111077 [Scylla paramamosain]|uniref:uncharacterized protein LOC135111077 n=1 Tax=Scylla paramamosain TaxID=85552 RepID=UPI0030834FC3
MRQMNETHQVLHAAPGRGSRLVPCSQTVAWSRRLRYALDRRHSSASLLRRLHHSCSPPSAPPTVPVGDALTPESRTQPREILDKSVLKILRKYMDQGLRD